MKLVERVRTTGRKAYIREEQESKILAAAEQVFGQFGLQGATMALIAERAGLPKPNVHYYFRSKEELYRVLLQEVLQTWLTVADTLNIEQAPVQALTAFVRAKLRFSRERPLASKVFANEIISGAPHLMPLLRGSVREFVDAKAAVFSHWIASGQLRPAGFVDPRHLLFLLWAMTQTYADFQVQMTAVLNHEHLTNEDYQAAEDTILTLLLRGLGAPQEFV